MNLEFPAGFEPAMTVLKERQLNQFAHIATEKPLIRPQLDLALPEGLEPSSIHLQPAV